MPHPPSACAAARWFALILCFNLSASLATAQTGTECIVTVAGQVQQYRACFKVPHTAKDFFVYFSLDPAPSDPTGSSVLSMALSTQSPGYVAVGFPTNSRDDMVASYAAILQDCSTCSASAALLEWYWMSGYEMKDVVPSSMGNVSASAAAARSGGQLAGSFTLALPGVGVDGSVSAAYDSLGGSQRRRLLDDGDAGGRVDGAYYAWPALDYPLLFVYGWVKNGDELTVHKDTATGSVDLTRGAPGAANGGRFDVGVSSDSGLQSAHAWITTIAWGVIIPIGMFMPRYFKTRLQDTWWFAMHKFLAAGGFVLALIGVILGIAATESAWDFGKTVHRDLGIAATVLGFVQCFALIKRLRPAPDHRYRRYWFWFHSWTGRSATILAIANIYYGIVEVENLGAWALAAYSSVLGVIVVMGVALEWRDFKARMSGVSAAHKDSGSAVEDGEAPLKPDGPASHEAAEVDLARMGR